jgi:copper chaperone
VRREIWNSLALVAGVLVLAVGAPWFVGQIRSLPSARTLAARADQRIVTLDVAGMTCNGCATTVKSRIGEVPGVSAVEVRYRQNRAYVVCDPAVPDSALTGAVHRAGPGFIASLVKR